MDFFLFSCGATPSRTVIKTQPLEVAFSLRERVDLRSQKEKILGKKIAWERVGWTRQKKRKKDAQKKVGKRYTPPQDCIEDAHHGFCGGGTWIVGLDSSPALPHTPPPLRRYFPDPIMVLLMLLSLRLILLLPSLHLYRELSCGALLESHDFL